jgi:glycosyltransferase involved in cell wall biosynthesis
LGYLNTTLSGPILDTFNENYKCFYVGTNWELVYDYLTYNRQIVVDLIKKMDNLDIISIYGPKKAWKDVKSYVGEIDFDGTSIVYEIKKCGICLVLSSHHHIEDSVCSNRLFEGLAAGVPIISDKNPFIYMWFGDNIFYIDNSSPDVSVKQIQEYINYIKNYPDETREKIQNCRKIFCDNFLMDKQLSQIVENVKQYKSV